MDHPQHHCHANNRRICRSALVFAVFAFLFAGVNAVDADKLNEQVWGYETPAGRCVVCHSLEEGGPFRAAPNLYGIVGADKARDRSWYSYSPALVQMGGVWTSEELDEYLANAGQFLPGTTKTIQVNDAGERERIIEFLSQLDN